MKKYAEDPQNYFFLHIKKLKAISYQIKSPIKVFFLAGGDFILIANALAINLVLNMCISIKNYVLGSIFCKTFKLLKILYLI